MVKGKLMLVPTVPRTISQGVVELERVQASCPACGQPIEAVARDGRVKGYCAVAKQDVNFPIIKTQLETRIKQSATMKKLWQDPEFRARQSAARKEQHQNAEFQINQSTTMKKLWRDPEYRASQSAITKKLWQDPEYRAKQIATHAGKHHTAEHRAKISAGLKRHNKNRGDKK